MKILLKLQKGEEEKRGWREILQHQMNKKYPASSSEREKGKRKKEGFPIRIPEEKRRGRKGFLTVDVGFRGKKKKIAEMPSHEGGKKKVSIVSPSIMRERRGEKRNILT